jgi:hypothetical protein
MAVVLSHRYLRYLNLLMRAEKDEGMIEEQSRRLGSPRCRFKLGLTCTARVEVDTVL